MIWTGPPAHRSLCENCPGELVHVDQSRVLGFPVMDMSMCTPWSMTTPAWPKNPRLPGFGPTCAGFMLRAAHSSPTGIALDRVMTDNAMAYRRSQPFADALSEIGAAHKLDPTVP